MRVVSRKMLHFHASHGTQLEDDHFGHLQYDIPDDLFSTAHIEMTAWISHLSLVLDDDLIDQSNNALIIGTQKYYFLMGRPTFYEILQDLNNQQNLVRFDYLSALNILRIVNISNDPSVDIDFETVGSCADIFGFTKSQYTVITSITGSNQVNMGVPQLLKVRSNIGMGGWETRPDGTLVSGDCLAVVPIKSGSFTPILYTDESGLHRVMLKNQSQFTSFFIKITDAHTGKVLKIKKDWVFTITIEIQDYERKRANELAVEKSLKQLVELNRIDLLQRSI